MFGTPPRRPAPYTHPRLRPAPAAFSVAVCELSGQVLLYQPADFERVTEAEVAAAFRATCCATFEAVRPRVRELFV